MIEMYDYATARATLRQRQADKAKARKDVPGMSPAQYLAKIRAARSQAST